jgi:NAD(P)-dependent dehydrogenase (short-subunit alcohol dehydrogenase family)
MQPDARRILITGAGSGIGRALAQEAARSGARVALAGRRAEPLGETRLLLGGACDVIVAPMDVTDAGHRRALAQRLADTWGGLDVVVNNAGVVEGGPLEESRDDQLQALFATNVLGPMGLVRDLAPLLLRSRTAQVVNVGSMFGDVAYPGFAAYSASKFALRGFSDALRREWKAKGVQVSYVAPRATRTPAAAAFAALIASTGMSLDDPEAVARRIWRAISQRRDRLYPTGPERLYVLLQALWPRLVDKAIAPAAPKPAPTALR